MRLYGPVWFFLVATGLVIHASPQNQSNSSSPELPLIQIGLKAAQQYKKFALILVSDQRPRAR